MTTSKLGAHDAYSEASSFLFSQMCILLIIEKNISHAVFRQHFLFFFENIRDNAAHVLLLGIAECL